MLDTMTSDWLGHNVDGPAWVNYIIILLCFMCHNTYIILLYYSIFVDKHVFPIRYAVSE